MRRKTAMQLPTDWLDDPEQVRLFEERMRRARMPRRQFMALLGAIGAAATAAACGATATPTSAPAAATAAATRPAGSPATTGSPAAPGAVKLSTWGVQVQQPGDLGQDQTF